MRSLTPPLPLDLFILLLLLYDLLWAHQVSSGDYITYYFLIRIYYTTCHFLLRICYTICHFLLRIWLTLADPVHYQV